MSDVRRDRAVSIAKLSRSLSLSMAEVRSMTVRDIEAMSEVMRKEQQEAQRTSQARQRLARARKPRRG